MAKNKYPKPHQTTSPKHNEDYVFVAKQDEDFEVVMSGLDAIFDYLKDQTWLQSMSHIAKMYDLGSAKGAAGASNFLQNTIGSQVPFSSMLSAIERIPELGGDPTNRLVVPDRNLPRGIQTLYAGLARRDDRLPWTEQKGPVLKDRFLMILDGELQFHVKSVDKPTLTFDNKEYKMINHHFKSIF